MLLLLMAKNSQLLSDLHNALNALFFDCFMDFFLNPSCQFFSYFARLTIKGLFNGSAISGGFGASQSDMIIAC